jgi:hypothetical protein
MSKLCCLGQTCAVRRDYRLLACDNTIEAKNNPPNTNKLTKDGDKAFKN